MFCPVCRADYPADYKVCPKDATHLLASARIGKYQIDALIGIGGMGAVYRAVNPDTKARVAIKLMHPTTSGSESARARFQREAAAVAALRTTHVVKVYDFGTEADGTLYLVMELLEGHSLRDEIVPAPDRMDLARVQMVIDGALKGLAAAHRAGVVHRDLKPDNVFIADTDDGEVPKLLDFGIARVAQADADLTRTGSLMGTAAYMAIEQVSASHGEIGPWSDVYAMGAILYEMLAGVPAYGGSSLTEVLHRVMQADAVPLATLRPDLPPAIYALVERCTSLAPTDRPQDAEAMRAALLAAQLVPPGTAIPAPPTLRAPNRTRLATDPTEGAGAPSPLAHARTALAGSADAATSSLRAPAAPLGHADTLAADAGGADHDATSLQRPSRAGKLAHDETIASSTAHPRTAEPGPATDASTLEGPRPVAATSAPPAPSRGRWPLVMGALVVAGVGGVLALRALRTPPSPPPEPGTVATMNPADAQDAETGAATGAVTGSISNAMTDAAPDAAPDATDVIDAAEGTVASDAVACSAKELRVAARAAAEERNYKKAIELATQGLTCGGHEAALHTAIVFAACKLGDEKLVMKHYYVVSRPRIEAARSICRRQGVVLP